MSELTKIAIRAASAARRAALPSSTREAAGRLITRRVLAMPQVTQASTVLAYASTTVEVPTEPLVLALEDLGVRVLLPRQTTSGIEVASAVGPLEPGPHGILEPTGPNLDLEAVEVILIPGIAFDRRGHRIGHGTGAYDRLLAASRATRIGLAFACQIVSHIPDRPHDQAVGFIITEEGMITCR